jgi:hypothetical protein
MHTSSTISFYISLGSYQKTFAATLPLGQHFYFANSISTLFFEHFLSSHSHLLLFFVLCVVLSTRWFYIYIYIYVYLFDIMCRLLCAHFQDVFSLHLALLLLLFATIFFLHHSFFPYIYILLPSYLSNCFPFYLFFGFMCASFFCSVFILQILMQVFMCLQFPIAFYIKQCKVFLRILHVFSYLFYLFFFLPFTMSIN